MEAAVPKTGKRSRRQPAPRAAAGAHRWLLQKDRTTSDFRGITAFIVCQGDRNSLGKRLAVQSDVSNRQPRFRSDLIARPVRSRGGRYIEILDPQSGSKMRFSSLGYSIAYLMNGDRDLGALADRIQSELGIDMPVVKLVGLVERLEKLGCLERKENRGRPTIPISPAALDAAISESTPNDVLATGEYRRVRRDAASGDPRNLKLDELVTQLHAVHALDPATARPPSSVSARAARPKTPAPIRNRKLPTHVAARQRSKQRVKSDPHNAVVMVPTLDPTHESLHMSFIGGSTSVVLSGRAPRFEDSPPITNNILWIACVLLGASCVWASWSLLRHL